MTTPSKRRRAAREWMKAETDRRERLSEKHRSDLSRVRKEVERELTKVIPKNNEGVSYPLGKPDAPYYEVMEVPDWRGAVRFDPLEANLLENAYVQRHRFRLTQHAYRLPDGHTVCWFGLEPCR